MSFWDQMLEEFETLGQSAAEWIPKIIVALIVLIVGRWLIGLVRKLIVKFMGLGIVQGVIDRAGITTALKDSDQSAAKIVGTIVYGYLYVVLWLVVFQVLELGTLETLLERFLAWIPAVLLSALVIVIAAAVGSWVAGVIEPFAKAKGVGWTAVVAQVSVIVFGVLFALDLLAVTFALNIVMILTSSLAVAVAIAFGVGGIDTAKKWWAKYASPKDSGYGGG